MGRMSTVRWLTARGVAQRTQLHLRAGMNQLFCMIIAFSLTGCETSTTQLGPSSSPARPELPRDTIRFTPPEVTGRTLRVDAGGSLQAAIDSASPGDEIVVASDGTWSAPISLPQRSGDGWITIRGEATLPSFGGRVSKSQAESLPEIVVADNGNDGFVISDTEGWWIRGVAVTSETTQSSNQAFRIENSSRVVVDRSAVLVPSGNELRRGFLANGGSIMIIGNRLEGLNTGGDQESQGVALWTGPGPLRVHNNFIEAAGEGLIAGGANISNPSSHPRNIEFTRNHVYKRPSWENAEQIVKAGFELKDARRVLVEGNVFENTWAGQGQPGFMWIIKSTDQTGGDTCDECHTEDVTMRKNKIINTIGGFTVNRRTEDAVEITRRVLIEDLIIEKWDRESDFDSEGSERMFQIGGGSPDLTLRRISGVNTVQNKTFIELADINDPPASGLNMSSIEVGPTDFGVRGSATMGDLYDSGTTFSDIYAVENSDGICNDKTQSSAFADAYHCVASASDIPSGVGADEAAVDEATSGVRDDNLPN